MSRRTPLFVSAALAAIRAVAWIVPRRDRPAWRREWEGEIHHSAWRSDMVLFRRALGSIADAAWLRRQFTRDNEWTQDVTHAWRQVRARPRVFMLAVFMLAVGIGATSSVVSLTDRLVLRALPYEEPQALVSLWQRNGATGNDREEIAPGNFLDWTATATAFEALGAAEPYSVDMDTGDRPEVVTATKVTDGFFKALRTRPQLGRLFEPQDFTTGSSKVTVISHTFWQRLGSPPAIVGQALRFDDTAHVVIGVLARGAEINLFDERGERDVWLPKVIQDYERRIRGEGWWASIARLKPGITRAQAQVEMDVVTARLAQEHPRTNARTTVAVVPLESTVTRTMKPALTMLLGAAVFVLLIACANVANLLLVRGTERQQEFALRGALGATRARLLRQLLVESALLAVTATIAGVGLAWLTTRAVIALSPTTSRVVRDITLDSHLLIVAVVVGGLTALLFGVAPAVQFSRRTRLTSQAGERAGTGNTRARVVRDVLVVAEIAIAVVLAIGVGLLLRSFSRVMSVHPGFNAASSIAIVQIFAYDRHDTSEKLRTYHAGIVDRLLRIPGVTDAGSASAMPMIAANINIESPFGIDGRPPARRGEEPTGFLTVASPGYFRVMGIPTIEGRSLVAGDHERGAPVVLVSRTLAQRYWPDGKAIGSWLTFSIRGDAQRRQVVGVVGELRHDALELPPRDEIFIPFAQAPFGAMTFVMHTDRDPTAVITPAKEAIWAIDGRQTIYDEGTIQTLLSQVVAPRRFALVLSAAFALVALLLAAVGVYAVMSFTTQQRTREFGVRMALGASSRQIGRDVLGRGARLSLFGVALGLAGAVAAQQAIRAQLFDVSPFDPLTLSVVVLAVVTVAAIACAAPARRAMRTDPAITLRADAGGPTF